MNQSLCIMSCYIIKNLLTVNRNVKSSGTIREKCFLHMLHSAPQLNTSPEEAETKS